MTLPRLFKTEAIVLRQRKLGEADRILTLYTPTYGKLDAKAKGVRKTTSRMSGHLQPLTRCMVQLARGRSMEVIAGCQALESFAVIREDLQRLSRALYAAELVDRFVPEHVESHATYHLLLDTLRRLAQALDADSVLRYFEMRLLEHSGFRPELARCLGCERQLQPVTNYFSPGAGGTLCPECAGGTAGPRPLSVNALKVMRLLQRGSYNDMARLQVPPELGQEIERHLRSYIVHVLERDVNAAAFIERLRRDALFETIEV
ncbi:MAG: DNA repair protein RecO [Chloroflexi bacterium]|nr:DNA repair protein RecO [Chloroflexota bacterium]